MNRRRFLTTAIATLALPGFAQAFGGDPAKLADVSAAFKRAVAGSRKLLVFVVPQDDGEKWRRGQVLGEFLNHGPEASLARLADVELVAASMAELRTLVPGAPSDEPFMVLVDPSVVPSRAARMQPAFPREKIVEDFWTDQGRKMEDAQITARIAAIAATIDGALRAPEDVARAHGRYRNTILRAPIAGSEWSVESGCGSYIEGREDQPMYDCGMGHVAERSARMLHFFPIGV